MNKRLINIDAEKSAIASLLTIEGSYDEISGLIHKHDFAAERHQIIFEAISELANSVKSYDVVMVMDWLQSHEMIGEKAVPEDYLGELLDTSPASLFQLNSYSESIKNKSVRRQSITHLKDAVSKLEVTDSDTEAVTNDVIDSLTGVLTHTAGTTVKTVHDMMGDFYDELQYVKDHGQQFVRTGFLEIDNKMMMSAGDLVIVAARPSMGKTALVMNWLTTISKDTQGSAVFFSLEMSSNQIMQRLASSECDINLSSIRSGNLDEGDWIKLQQFIASQQELPLLVIEKPEITISQIRTELKRISREHGNISVIAVDYLQIMGGLDGADRVNKMGVVTRTLKALGKEYGCPVVLLSQLNRSVEQRPNKRPVSSDLRDSGAIEQDADVISMIYRDDYYKSKETDAEGRVKQPKDGMAEIIFTKVCNGATGTVVLGFEGQFSRFVERMPNVYVDDTDYYCNDFYAGAS